LFSAKLAAGNKLLPTSAVEVCKKSLLFMIYFLQQKVQKSFDVV